MIKRCLSGEDPFVVWGSPDVVRDFLYVKDMIKGCLLVLEKGESMKPYNVGYGTGVEIGDIVNTVSKSYRKKSMLNGIIQNQQQYHFVSCQQNE